MIGSGAIIRFSKNDYITLSEGDVINIKTNIDRNKLDRAIKITFENFLLNSLNFNFTFLIELDPL